MDELNLEFKSLHHIDIYSPSINPVDISSNSNDIDEYITELLDKVTKNNNKRIFEFQSETCEIKTALNLLLKEKNFPIISEIIAKRLHRQEIDAQEKYGHLTNIHKGSLLQFLLNGGESYKYIITKVDHNRFIDEGDLLKHFGLPFEKRVLKAAIIELTNDCQVIKIDIYDSNTTISQYWWKNFLELIEVNSDEHNTKMAFNVIDNILKTKLQKKSPADYTYIRNSTVSYFRSQESFLLDNFMDYVFSAYRPINLELDLNDLKEKIRSAPESKNFDSQFIIEKDAITAKFKRTIHLHEKIDLNMKEDIENLEKIILAFKNPAGEKFVQIKSENGYDYFKKLENNNE